MAWNYAYFTEAEMQCKDGCGGLPKDELMQILIAMRIDAGFPFKISSGFRCAAYNQRVAKTGADGPHTTGLAADIEVFGSRALKVIELAMKHGILGLGVSQKGSTEDRFIHVDCIQPGVGYPRPGVWSY